MDRLDHQDLGILLSAVATLHSDFTAQTLPERMLAAAATIIAADRVSFTGFRYDGAMADLIWDDGEGYSPAEVDVFQALMHEHPLYRAYISEGRTETLKITDILPEYKFERTALYNEFYRRVGVSNQLVTPIPVSNEMFVTCSINIKDRDFSERDKMVLNLMSPHFTSAINNAFAYERVSGTLEKKGCAIVALSADGKPEFISEFGQILFRKYFPNEKCGERSLPETIKAWIEQTKLATGANVEFPLLALKVRNDGGEMTARLSLNGLIRKQILVLEEKLSPSPKAFEQLRLTPREAEVMFLITQGKSDPVIAILLNLSVRTVHKHVENIYQKLGVETRTAAMLRGLDLLNELA